MIDSVSKVIIIILLSTPFQTKAGEKLVNCEIVSLGRIAYKGECLFFPMDKAGSFELSHPSKKKITDDIVKMHVYVVGKDTAIVRGQTIINIDSLWGNSKRYSKDRACWINSEFDQFKVCAWEIK